jgi:hypothetical protein
MTISYWINSKTNVFEMRAGGPTYLENIGVFIIQGAGGRDDKGFIKGEITLTGTMPNAQYLTEMDSVDLDIIYQEGSGSPGEYKSGRVIIHCCDCCVISGSIKNLVALRPSGGEAMITYVTFSRRWRIV